MTRTDCECIVCKVGHAMRQDKVDVSEYIETLSPKSKIVEVPLCPKCFSTKETESVHQCSTKQQTIANLQQKLPQKLQEQLSAKVIKDKVNESGNKGTELSTFGKPLPVSIGMGSVASTSNNKSFSHDDILSMQRDMNLSDAKTKKMAKHIREETYLVFDFIFTLHYLRY